MFLSGARARGVPHIWHFWRFHNRNRFWNENKWYQSIKKVMFYLKTTMNSITSTLISRCVRIRLIKNLVPVQIPVHNLESWENLNSENAVQGRVLTWILSVLGSKIANRGKMKAYRPAPKLAMANVHSTLFHPLFLENAFLGVWYCFSLVKYDLNSLCLGLQWCEGLSGWRRWGFVFLEYWNRHPLFRPSHEVGSIKPTVQLSSVWIKRLSLQLDLHHHCLHFSY